MAREFQGDPVYLDYNATTPTDPSLLGELDRVLRREWGNPASIHIMGGEASLKEDAARATAARYFGKPQESFLFCSSGCEGISGILSGTEAKHRRLITTVADHSVLTQSAQKLFPGRHLLAGIDGNGKIRIDGIASYLNAYPGECCLFYSPVNHETGARQDGAALFNLAREKNALVFIDGVQAAYRLEPEEWAPYCHGLVISGHKFHVPKGIALVQLDEGVKREPCRFGGVDEENLFPGTANVPGITLLGKGLELMERNRAVNGKILRNLTAEGESIIKSCRTPVIRESPPDAVPGILCLSLPELGDMEKFFLHLGERRLCLSRFSACTGSVEGESEVLRSMGVPAERSTKSLRLSFGRFSKRQDFFALKEAIDSYV